MTIDQLQTEFRDRFTRTPSLYRAPGRVNIIGEHCDYNDGFVMPVNIGLYTWLAMAPREDRKCRVWSRNLEATGVFELDSIERGGGVTWLEYFKCVAWALQEAGLAIHGADIMVHGDIPLGGGLSSSASLEAVLACGWLAQAGIEIDRGQMARWCKRAENEFVGVQCGIMDQYVICLGARGHAMKLDCRSLDFQQVPLPFGACILVVDTGVKHSLGAGDYNTRRSECQAAVAALARHNRDVKALRDASPEMLDAHRKGMDDAAYRRARHVVGEIRRVHAAETAMRTDDLDALGDLLNASHASLRDDFEVSCAELDTLAEIARDCPGVYGARMVGGGWGGCVIALIEEDCLDKATGHIVGTYAGYSGTRPWHHVVTPADPVGAVGA